MNKIKLAAIILSLLIISIPVCFAARLDVTASGTQGVDGYIGGVNETLTFTALAEMPGNPAFDVAATRVRVCPPGQQCEFFQRCVAEGSLYRCTYSTADIISSGSEIYKIKLFDMNDYEIATKDVTVMVDEKSPRIITFSIAPEISRTGDVEVNYRVEDYATGEIDDTTYCTGLKDVVVTVDGQEIKRASPGKNVCEKQESFSYSYPASGQYAGVDVCISAKDYFNQEDLECKEFRVDNSPPRISSLRLFGVQGYELTHIRSTQTVRADVYVAIEGEDDVVRSSVKADLSRLNPSLSVRGPDAVVGDDYVWQDITVTNPDDCAVAVSARDEIGNNASRTVTCTLPIDDTGPSPVSLATEAMDSNGTALLSASGKFFAEFTEAGAGMDNALAYLSLTSIGLGSSVRANYCEHMSGDTWRCVWNNVVPAVGTGNYNVRLTQQTVDDAGNMADNYLEVPVIVDKTAPKINSIHATFVHQTADYGPRAVNGDSIEFLVDVTGATEGFADLSELGGDLQYPLECTPTQCTLNTTIEASGPANTTVYFEFNDDAKNIAREKYSFFLYGIMNSTEENYWDTSVSCSPRLIDRYTAEYYEHPVYCSIKITKHQKNHPAEVVFTEIGDLADCTGDIAYVVDMEAINNQYGSRDPYAVFTLAATEFSVNEVKFSCPVWITSRIGDYFLPVSEKEDLNITLNFYNLPYGELYDNHEARIRKVMEDNVELISWVTQVEDFLEYARMGCNIKNHLSTIIAGLDAVLYTLATLSVLAYAINPSGGYYKTLDKMRIELCKGGTGPLNALYTGLGKALAASVTGGSDSKAKFNILDLLCKLATCQLTKEDEAAGKNLVEGVNVIGIMNNPICKGVKNWQKGWLDIDVESPTDVRESMVLSAACLCLPGITYNLNKLRQINCKYAICLGSEVLEKGYPTSYCHDERSYLLCTFWMHQLFELIPFSWLYNQMSSMVQEFYANPISIVAAVSGCLCGGCLKRIGSEETEGGKTTGWAFDYCTEQNFGEMTKGPGGTIKGILYFFCTVAKTAAKLGDAITAINAMRGENYWKYETTDEYCKAAEDMLE